MKKTSKKPVVEPRRSTTWYRVTNQYRGDLGLKPVEVVYETDKFVTYLAGPGRTRRAMKDGEFFRTRLDALNFYRQVRSLSVENRRESLKDAEEQLKEIEVLLLAELRATNSGPKGVGQ